MPTLTIESEDQARVEALLHEAGIPFEALPDDPWLRRKGETNRAYEAFTVYLGLGPTRSLANAAQTLGKAKVTLEGWSVKWGWQERVAAWDDHAAAKQRERDEIERQEGRKRISDDQLRVAKKGRVLAERWLDEFGETTDEQGRKRPARKTVSLLTAQEVRGLLQVCTHIERLAAGQTTGRIEFAQISGTVDRLIEVALRYVPEESHAAFLEDLDEVAGVGA